MGATNIKKILNENNLTVDDIKMFCFSQYAYASIEEFREVLGIDESKSIFIGNEYGYTGTSSPFIALYESLKKGLIKRDDYVMFWTVGAGSENISLLLKY
jgi:3-oxoacyl-[acyl-carrier-protein] synthase-3